MSSPASQGSNSKQRRSIRRRSIRVAILCPRESEAQSIIALFDEHHTDQSYGRTFGDDPNQYSIGTLAKRDVVVAYRPSGDQSLSGDIAKWCRKSFVNVHLALVVGICNGLHNYIDRDTHPGDVIIAVRLMHYDQERDSHSIIGTLPKDGKGKEVLEMRSLLQKQKQYKSKSDTKDSSRSEDGQPGAKEGNSNKRTSPKVYYGSLTSGSIYMNSRALQLAEKTGALGVDVGSLDVSKVLPCVIIKGISNYGDGHQKPEWIDSAGESAAASTRALLEDWNKMLWLAKFEPRYLLNPVVEPENNMMPFPRSKKAMFLIELANLHSFDSVWDAVCTLDDSDEHDTMYCVLYHMCTNYTLENKNKALGCIFSILNKGYNPNWNIAQNTTADCFGTPWVQFLLVIINLPRSSAELKDTAISHWVSLFIKLFLDRGASLEMRFPVVFWPGVGPFTGNYARCFYGLDMSTSRYLYIEMNVKALIELIASLRKQSGSSIHRGYTLPDVESYMRVVGFKGGADEKISLVTYETDSDLLVEAVRNMCDVELEDHGQSRTQMSERAYACTMLMENLANECPSATEELCWKGTPWRKYM